MERKLATVRKIAALDPIPGADAIEVATVDGWKVVTQKGLHKVGDHVIYLEIDSFLPKGDPRYEFLMKSGVRTFEGVEGHKLRTIKLRGQVSQGLLLPLREFIDDFVDSKWDEGQELSEFFFLGADLTEFLGIKKWEAQIPACLGGLVKGAFPSFIKKTDQERCQNLVTEIFAPVTHADSQHDEGVERDAEYEISVKLDGTSVTYYHYNGVVGACSRNLELKINDENKDNTIVKTLLDSGLFDVLPKLGNVAIQGELMGPGIQGNREGLKKPKFFIFDIQNLDRSRYFSARTRSHIMSELAAQGISKDFVDHVPIIGTEQTLSGLGITNVDELLKFAEGPSILHPVREGLVFKRHDGEFSFKAISNKFLMKDQ